MINLGDEVRDTVSGFQGIAIGKTLFLNGCARVGVQPPVNKEGALPQAEWFDEPQLAVIKPEKAPAGPRNVGGPMVSMPTRNTPR